MAGLKFFTLRNRLGSSVIPSTKNFFDTFQIRKVLCDDHATCTVLPIADTSMLTKLFSKYDHCLFTLAELRTVAEVMLLVLRMQSVPNQPKMFEFRIGLDIYPTSRSLEPASTVPVVEAAAPEPTITSENCRRYQALTTSGSVNFFLCSEDVEFMLSNPIMVAKLKRAGSDRLLSPYPYFVARRDSAMLGSDFLGPGEGSVAYSSVTFHFDTGMHHLEACSWRLLAVAERRILSKKYLHPSSVDFAVLDSIEPNDILGVAGDEEADPYDERMEV
jgi:hypothetical protein